MIARLGAASAGFDADQLHARVVRRTDRTCRPRCCRRRRRPRRTSGSRPSWRQRLLDRFAADDRLEVAHDLRERMRPDDRADDVVRRLDERIQSRIASLIASRSVREPLVTGRTSAPIIFMLKTLSFWRRMSSSPM